jgi:hypothetical protein
VCEACARREPGSAASGWSVGERRRAEAAEHRARETGARLVEAVEGAGRSASVSRSCAWIGSPCLRHGGHGASIGALLAGLPGAALPRRQRPPGAPGVSMLGCGSMLTEIYVGHACSCHHILRTEPAAQALVIPAELASSSSSSSSSSDTDAEEAANDLAAVRCSARHMRLDVLVAHMRDGRNQRLASRRYIEASCADTHGGLIQTVGGRRWRTWCRSRTWTTWAARIPWGGAAAVAS